MIKPRITNPQQKIYMLDRHCACGEHFIQQVIMQYGNVLTFPITIAWFYGHRQDAMHENMVHVCDTCQQHHMAIKPEEVHYTEWDEKYIKRCKAMGVFMENDGAVDWPVMSKQEAMHMAGERLEQYGGNDSWYKAWAENPATIHHILDKFGNVVADTVVYGEKPAKPDISIHIEDVDFDWKG